MRGLEVEDHEQQRNTKTVMPSFWFVGNVLNLLCHWLDSLFLGRRVRQQINPPQTLQDLQRALAEQWRRLPRPVFTYLLRSMFAKSV